jgi:hypothetical protein
MVPQSVRELLEALEHIKRASPKDKVKNGHKTTVKSKDSLKRKRVSFDERIPKKCSREKHSLLCKKHGGTHTTHNTLDCQKYNPYGTPKKIFNGKKYNRTSHGPEKTCSRRK